MESPDTADGDGGDVDAVVLPAAPCSCSMLPFFSPAAAAATDARSGSSRIAMPDSPAWSTGRAAAAASLSAESASMSALPSPCSISPISLARSALCCAVVAVGRIIEWEVSKKRGCPAGSFAINRSCEGGRERDDVDSRESANPDESGKRKRYRSCQKPERV